jgi:hypothetical protein
VSHQSVTVPAPAPTSPYRFGKVCAILSIALGAWLILGSLGLLYHREWAHGGGMALFAIILYAIGLGLLRKQVYGLVLFYLAVIAFASPFTYQCIRSPERFTDTLGAILIAFAMFAPIVRYFHRRRNEFFDQPIDLFTRWAVKGFIPTEGQTQMWLCLRSLEWSIWPGWLSPLFAPLLLCFYPWYAVIACILIASAFWCLVRYSVTSPELANLGALAVGWLKWPEAIICAIYLLFHHRYIAAALALGWPLFAGFLGFPSGLNSRIADNFAEKLYSSLMKTPWVSDR